LWRRRDMIKLLGATAITGAMISRGTTASGATSRVIKIGHVSPWNLEAVYAVFPVLKEKRKVAAMALSGGQQQMVAIGRALLANPQLLLCDEISLGLAPVIIKELYAQFERIVASGTTLVIVEQDIKQAMAVSDRVYCLREGRVVLEGRPPDLKREELTNQSLLWNVIPWTWSPRC
jgi:ABC-type branched-subunit amino acid transport system ATPase component